MKKTEILLLLFYRLYSGKAVSKAAFCRETSIAERSFYRYLSDIRSFGVEFGTGLEISSDGEGNYAMKKQGNYL